MPDRDAPVAATAPNDTTLTAYDHSHFVTYLRLLDADADSADWREVARIVLKLEPDKDEAAAQQCYATHLARAKWMTEHGYRYLLLDS